MDERQLQQKANKYKMKYLALKQKGGKSNSIQRGGAYMGETNNIQFQLGLIELYDKTLNEYLIYRFRYGSNCTLFDIQDLSNQIYRLRESAKYAYTSFYIPNLMDQPNKVLEDHLQSVIDHYKVLFTLRQDTTKLLKEVILINTEAVAKVEKYIKFLDKLIDMTKNTQIPALIENLKEIQGKCNQIKGLVLAGTTEFVAATINDSLDLIRNETNFIMNAIGNDIDNYVITLKPYLALAAGIEQYDKDNKDIYDSFSKTVIKKANEAVAVAVAVAVEAPVAQVPAITHIVVNGKFQFCFARLKYEVFAL